MNINFKQLFLSLLFALSIIGIIFFGYIFISNIPKFNFSMPKTKTSSEIPNSPSIKSDLNQAFAVFNTNFNSNSENLNQLNTLVKSGNVTSEEISKRFLDVTFTERFGIKKTLKQQFAYRLGFVNNCKNAKCFAKNSIDAYDLPLYPAFKGKDYSYIKLKNGTAYAFTYKDSNCQLKEGGYDNVCGYGYVDTNGKKKPNILNVDIFQFRLIRNPKNGYITMKPFFNEKNYKNLRDACFTNGGSCTSYAIKGDTSYITNRRIETCQKKVKNEVWLDKESNCCTSDKTKACCEINSVFKSKRNGHFIEKDYLGAKENTCCYSQNDSELCCKALTGADGYLANGKCVSGTIKTKIENGKFNFVINSNSTQGMAYLISKDDGLKNLEIVGSKSGKGLNLNPKIDYMLYSTYENYGAKLKIARGSCQLKNLGDNYYLLTNKKAGETCVVSFWTSQNKVTKAKDTNIQQQCNDCSKEVSRGSHKPCCK